MIHFFALNKNNANFEKPEVFSINKNELMINEQIRDKEVRLIDTDGTMLVLCLRKRRRRLQMRRIWIWSRLPSSRTACVQDNGLRQVYV